MILITVLIILLTISGYLNHVEGKVEKKIIDLSEQYLEELYHESEFEVKVKWMPPGLKSKDASIIEKINFRKRELPRGLTSIEVMAGSEVFPIQLEITVLTSLPVAAKLLRAGDEFSSDDVITRKIDVTRLQELPVTDLGNGTWTAKRDIQPGSPFFERDIQKGEVLTRGQQVKLLYDAAGVDIEMNCEIRRQAAPGESVILYCEDTGKRYKAILNENKTATWIKTL